MGFILLRHSWGFIGYMVCLFLVEAAKRPIHQAESWDRQRPHSPHGMR